MTGAELRELFGPATWTFETITDEQLQKAIDEVGFAPTARMCLLWEEDSMDPDEFEDLTERVEGAISERVEKTLQAFLEYIEANKGRATDDSYDMSEGDRLALAYMRAAYEAGIARDVAWERADTCGHANMHLEGIYDAKVQNPPYPPH